MKEMSSEAATEWEKQCKNKYFYIFKTALISGLITAFIFVSLMFLTNSANEYKDVYSIVVFCVSSFVFSSIIYGSLSALGSWRANENKYKSYLEK